MKHFLTISLILITGFCFGQNDTAGKPIKGTIKKSALINKVGATTSQSEKIVLNDGKDLFRPVSIVQGTSSTRNWTISNFIICTPIDYKYKLMGQFYKQPEGIKVYDLVIKGVSHEPALTIDDKGNMVITDSLAAIQGLLFYMNETKKR